VVVKGEVGAFFATPSASLMERQPQRPPLKLLGVSRNHWSQYDGRL
jgi:hypothetical protein